MKLLEKGLTQERSGDRGQYTYETKRCPFQNPIRFYIIQFFNQSSGFVEMEIKIVHPILTIMLRNVLRTFEAEIFKLFKNIKPQIKIRRSMKKNVLLHTFTSLTSSTEKIECFKPGSHVLLLNHISLCRCCPNHQFSVVSSKHGIPALPPVLGVLPQLATRS